MQRLKRRESLAANLIVEIRFAFRSRRRSPAFTAVALATLALGIGASTARFSVLDTALGRALHFAAPDRLVMARVTWAGHLNPLATFPDYMDYRDQAGTLEFSAAVTGGAGLVTITGSEEPEQARRHVPRPAGLVEEHQEGSVFEDSREEVLSSGTVQSK